MKPQQHKNHTIAALPSPTSSQRWISTSARNPCKQWASGDLQKQLTPPSSAHSVLGPKQLLVFETSFLEPRQAGCAGGRWSLRSLALPISYPRPLTCSQYSLGPGSFLDLKPPERGGKWETKEAILPHSPPGTCPKEIFSAGLCSWPLPQQMLLTSGQVQANT